MYTVIIADSDTENRDNLSSLLKQQGLDITAETDTGQTCIELVRETKPDLIFVADNLPIVNGLEVSRVISAEYPHIIIVLLAIETSFPFLRNAMRAGVRDILIKPIEEEDVVEMLQNLGDLLMKKEEVSPEKEIQAVPPEPVFPTKKVIASVFSSKGGVGKSVIAANIAVFIRMLTRRKVVLVDLNLQFGDAAVLLNLTPQRTIIDLLPEAQRRRDPDFPDLEHITPKLVESVLTHHDSGLKLLAAPHNPVDAELLTPEAFELILKTLYESYDYIIIDTISLFQEPVLIALDYSDLILYTTSMSIPAIKNVKLGIDVMRSLHYPTSKVRLIINNVSNSTDLRYSDVESSLNWKIGAVISYDSRTVLDSIDSGEILVTTYPNARVTKDIEKIARMVVGGEILSDDKTQFDHGTGWLERLRKIF